MISGFSLSALAELVEAREVIQPLDGVQRADQLLISSVAPPAEAGPGQIACVYSSAAHRAAQASSASALVIAEPLAQSRCFQLVVDDPRCALARLLERFAPRAPSWPQGIDPRAVVDPSAEIATTARIAPFVVIGPAANVGAETLIEPFCVIGPGAHVGAGCRVGAGGYIGAGVTLGERVCLDPGAVIGSDGFGAVRDGASWRPLRSLGAARIGSDTRVGANSCVDAGTLTDTRIAAGVQIDNLVQVAHNVDIGERALLCAQVGLAGGVRIGRDAMLGGQVGVADGRSIGEAARVAAKSGVSADVEAGAAVAGYPAIAHGRWRRSAVLFSRLNALYRQVRQLADRLEDRLSGDSSTARRLPDSTGEVER
ncbi:MAG: UDP-3-O-(3-hydroxymyristoyl)glucosamine N-acyltransferase [Deltaproteobacteria bacterium]|nr:UDP-3-O-(3-hydroxymyristoyl)glucosamine N-acyltransferase [Deltaproteobacteria bacterium]